MAYTDAEILADYYLLYPESAKEGNDKNSPHHDPYFMEEVKEEIGMDWEDIPDHLWTDTNVRNFGG